MKNTFKLLFKNWLSLVGVTIFAGGFLSAVVLLGADLISPSHNSYAGIFTYIVAPGFMGFGAVLALFGALRHRRKLARGQVSALPVIDLNNRRHFMQLMTFLLVSFVFLMISALGAYKAYHFAESVEFCGTTCHDVMKPEYVAYQNSPHANVGCVECHIGPGADWFVKSKVDGLYQVYSVAFNKYHRPIETPLHNLRPADETCTQCHWPAKFFGAVEQVRTYTLPDKTNTPWTVRMLINVGGGSPEHGPAHGIHLHMALDNQVEYIAADPKRASLPWVRATNKKTGKVTVYRAKEGGEEYTPEKVAASPVRIMDCMDCHTRPSHRYQSPNEALDLALANGQIDRSLPWIKKNGVKVLTGEYATEPEALAAIRASLEKEYPEKGDKLEQAVAAIQKIYSNNFFPEMKVSWKEYPDHIGHKITKGCFRCHNEDHVSEDGTKTLHLDCKACHTIISQGPGEGAKTIAPDGLDFEHPEDIGDELQETPCSDCHEGVPVG